MCGATGEALHYLEPGKGLSPRVRGNHQGWHRLAHRLGSIPACAGQPLLAARPGLRPRVYPRVCGATLRMTALPNRGWGLSPRVRGNPQQLDEALTALGSIPACAGQPIRAAGPARRPGVYPRVCGATVAVREPATPETGLSPRVRGNRPKAHAVPGSCGSIPACAGQPAAEVFLMEGPWVYPRVCGATADEDGPLKPTGVYPRVCGATGRLSSACTARSGLSPRVRGNPSPGMGKTSSTGSIPACAGQPSLEMGAK